MDGAGLANYFKEPKEGLGVDLSEVVDEMGEDEKDKIEDAPGGKCKVNKDIKEPEKNDDVKDKLKDTFRKTTRRYSERWGAQ